MVILCKGNLKQEGVLHLNTPMSLNGLEVDVENDKHEVFVSFECRSCREFESLKYCNTWLVWGRRKYLKRQL